MDNTKGRIGHQIVKSLIVQLGSSRASGTLLDALTVSAFSGTILHNFTWCRLILFVNLVLFMKVVVKLLCPIDLCRSFQRCATVMPVL